MVKLVGIALIVLGVIALVYRGHHLHDASDKIIDVGPFKAEVKREKTIPLSPVVGVVALAGGVVLLLVAGAAQLPSGRWRRGRGRAVGRRRPGRSGRRACWSRQGRRPCSTPRASGS